MHRIADQDEDRFNRRSMVRLGVRVIHKITSESKPQPIIESNPNTLSKSLRLRLSPKALKLANKFSTSVDENQHRKLNGGGSMSRIDIEKRSSSTENRQSKLLTKVSFTVMFKYNDIFVTICAFSFWKRNPNNFN